MISDTDQSVSLHRIKVAQLRCFESFELVFASRPRTKGQWTLLLGDNGTGKTTLLRAIALAAAGWSDAHSLIKVHGAKGLVRHGATEALIDLSLIHI